MKSAAITRLGAILLLVATSGCQLELDGRKEVPAKLAGTIAQLKERTLANPSDQGALVGLAEAQLEAGMLFEAADNFSKAKAMGSNARILAGLANSYNQLGYMRSTVDQLSECRKIRPPHADCIYAAGRFFENFLTDVNDKDVKQRLRGTWLQFLAIAPADHPKRAYVKSAVDQLNAELGPPKFAPGPSSRPASQPAPGGAHGAAGQPAASPPPTTPPPAPAGHAGGAAPEPPPGEEVGELNPFGAAIQRAMSAYQKGDAKGAAAAFKDALKARPGDPLASAGLGEVLYVIGKKQESFKYLDAAYKAEPNDVMVRLLFGQVMLTARRRTDDAIKAWESLIKDAPDYAKQNKVPERLELFKRKLGEAQKLMGPGGAHPK